MIATLLNHIIEFLSERGIGLRRRQISEARIGYRGLSDEQLRQECRRALAGAWVSRPESKATGLGRKMHVFFLRLLFRHRGGAEDVPILALAIESFSRAPADLPSGSVLYPEQVIAASMLTRGCLVQMDTGEGKTYAILPAAFTLACLEGRVYILCASDYLAWRDAQRTRGYWNFVGLTPGLCLQATPPSSGEWSRRVIYTTLRTLMFKSLADEISTSVPTPPLTFGAVIMDEADAILLDQGNETYKIVHPLRGSAFDWSFALEHAQVLVEGKDIVVDRADLTATLTVEGEEGLRTRLEAQGIQSSQILLGRYAVELAYVAARVAEKQVDYIIEENHIYPIDRISGRVDRSRTPDWIIPLEVSRGLEPRPKTVPLHQSSPTVLLGQFAILSGTSGTIVDDGLEYFLGYGLLAIQIPPRFPRRGHVESDEVFERKELAYRHVCQRVLEAMKQSRPVLVGTQTIADAEEIYRLLQPAIGHPVHAHLLTGMNEGDAVKFFEQGGEVGSVIIATQLAGRGIDLRLSEAARQNGGMVLICVGHALDSRHDRQFLGRAGRHGDPFSAVFVCSLNDTLFRLLPTDWMRPLMQSLGEDEPIEHPLIDRAIRTAQKRQRYLSFLSRRYFAYRSDAEAEISNDIRSWFEYLQIPAETADMVSPDFLDRVLDHFIHCHLASLLDPEKEVDRDTADQVVAILGSALVLNGGSSPVRALEIEGFAGDAAHKIIGDKLNETLSEQLKRNQRLHDMWQEKADAVWELTLLDDLCTAGMGRLEAWREAIALPQHPQAPRSPLDEGSDESWADDTLDLVRQEGVLEPLVTELKSLVAAIDRLGLPEEMGGTLPSPAHRLLEVEQRLVVVREEIRTARQEAECLRGFLQRTPRNIASWSLRLAWIGFLEECERILHQTRQKRYSELEFHRIVTDRIMREWGRAEATISRRVLSNLLRAGQPEVLDNVFYLEDHRESDDRSGSNVAHYEWPPVPETGLPEVDYQSRPEGLIRQFVAESEFDLSPPVLTPSRLIRLLEDFTRRNPLYSLHTPDRIQQALEDWIDVEIENGVSKERRALNRFWLRRFLLYLRDRKLIGPLPTLRHQVKSKLLSYLKSLSEVRSVSVAAGCLGFGLLFGLVALYGDLLTPKALEPWASYLDAVLFGGMFKAGNILAPAMGSLVIGAGFVHLLTAQDRIVNGLGVDRFLVPLLHVVMAWWMVWGDGPRELALGTLARDVGLFSLIVLPATAVRFVVWTVHNESSIDLTNVWLCYCLLAVLLPAAALAAPSYPYALIAFGAFVLLFLAWDAINLVEIGLLSIHIRDVQSLEKAEEVLTHLRIKGGVGAAPHVFGTLLAWLVLGSLPVMVDQASPERTAIAAMPTELFLVPAYLIVAVGWLFTVLRRRLSPLLWAQELNSRRQIVPDATEPQLLEFKLGTLRKRLFRREAAFQAACVLVVSMMFAGQTLPGTNFPIALGVIAAASLFTSRIKDFAQQLYDFLFNRAVPRQEVLDLSLLRERKEDESFWQKIRTALSIRIALVLTILILVVKLAQLIVESQKLWEKIGR